MKIDKILFLAPCALGWISEMDQVVVREQNKPYHMARIWRVYRPFHISIWHELISHIMYVRLILFQGRPRLTELNLSEKVDCNLFDCATIEGHYYKLTKYGKGRAVPTGKINYNLEIIRLA